MLKRLLLLAAITAGALAVTAQPATAWPDPGTEFSFESLGVPGTCIELAEPGGTDPTRRQVRLRVCDPTNLKQRWLRDANTGFVTNVLETQFCLFPGGFGNILAARSDTCLRVEQDGLKIHFTAGRFRYFRSNGISPIALDATSRPLDIRQDWLTLPIL